MVTLLKLEMQNFDWKKVSEKYTYQNLLKLNWGEINRKQYCIGKNKIQHQIKTFPKENEFTLPVCSSFLSILPELSRS